jgi:hypothetical protein
LDRFPKTSLKTCFWLRILLVTPNTPSTGDTCIWSYATTFLPILSTKYCMSHLDLPPVVQQKSLAQLLRQSRKDKRVPETRQHHAKIKNQGVYNQIGRPDPLRGLDRQQLRSTNVRVPGKAHAVNHRPVLRHCVSAGNRLLFQAVQIETVLIVFSHELNTIHFAGVEIVKLAVVERHRAIVQLVV